MHSPAYAAPQGGQVSAGQATISQQQLTTDIHQSSQNAVINWQKFDIQPNETVNFHQPNAESITLNRVVGNEESAIRGAINANGNVFISNPNGVLIGKEAQINVGSLVATTQNIKDDDLMNNRLNFNGQAGGKVENNANIKVPKGGVIALIAPIVKNSGKLTASEGAVLLASAEQFRITLPKDNFSYTLDRGTLQGLVDNQGAILADGGRVVLTAKGIDAVKKSVIKHSGSIEANTVSDKNGVVELLGDLDHSELQMSGSIKAEGKGTQQGGQVETSAAKLKISEKANVSTKSEKGKTGKWTIDPKDFTVAKSGGDMSGQAVSNALKNNNVELKSRNGAKEGKGDVIINDEISWDKNTLTLNAENDIHINKTLNGSGTAKLALEYGLGSANGGEADYYLDKNTPLASRTVKVNLPEGKNFTTKKGAKGETIEFDVIHRMPEIVRNNNERNGTYSAPCEESCEQWKSAFTASNIAFGKDMDLSYTANYQGFAGWDISENGEFFMQVEGLGHGVDKLTLSSQKDYQPTGLFTKGIFNDDKERFVYIRNIGLTNISISSKGKYSHTGSAIGRIGGMVDNIYATGNITSFGGYTNTGGLVGSRVFGIANSYFSGNITASGQYSAVGGLSGAAVQRVVNSYVSAYITTSGKNSAVGGLVGRSTQNIGNSYALGGINVYGEESKTGGLIGMMDNTTYGSNITISDSYSNVRVLSRAPSAHVAGIVGHADTLSIIRSYALGSVEAYGDGSNAGGLVVSGSDSIYNSYYNRDSLIYSQHGAVIIGGANPKTADELKQQSTYKGWDFENTWVMGEDGYPKLRALSEEPKETKPDDILDIDKDLEAVALDETEEKDQVETSAQDPGKEPIPNPSDLEDKFPPYEPNVDFKIGRGYRLEMSGDAEANSKLEVRDKHGNVIHTYQVDSSGKYKTSIYLALANRGDVWSVVSIDKANNVSDPRYMKIGTYDPEIPVITFIERNNNSVVIRGTADPMSYIKFVNDKGNIVTSRAGRTNEEGYFDVEIRLPKEDAGNVKWFIETHHGEHKDDAVTNKDFIMPAYVDPYKDINNVGNSISSPIISSIQRSTGDLIVNGSAEPNARIEIRDEFGTLIHYSNANSDGKFNISIPMKTNYRSNVNWSVKASRGSLSSNMSIFIIPTPPSIFDITRPDPVVDETDNISKTTDITVNYNKQKGFMIIPATQHEQLKITYTDNNGTHTIHIKEGTDLFWYFPSGNSTGSTLNKNNGVLRWLNNLQEGSWITVEGMNSHSEPMVRKFEVDEFTGRKARLAEEARLARIKREQELAEQKRREDAQRREKERQDALKKQQQTQNTTVQNPPAKMSPTPQPARTDNKGNTPTKTPSMNEMAAKNKPKQKVLVDEKELPNGRVNPDSNIQVKELNTEVKGDSLTRTKLPIKNDGYHIDPEARALCGDNCIDLVKDIFGEDFVDEFVESQVSQVGAVILANHIKSVLAVIKTKPALEKYLGGKLFFRKHAVKYAKEIGSNIVSDTLSAWGYGFIQSALEESAKNTITHFDKDKKISDNAKNLFSKIISTTLTSAIKAGVERVKDKKDINPKVIFSDAITSTLDGLKESHLKPFVHSLVGGEGLTADTLNAFGDIVLDMSVALTNSAINSVIDSGGINPKFIIKFKTDAALQIALISGKQVMKTVRLVVNILEQNRNNVEANAQFIRLLAATKQRVEYFSDIGASEKANKLLNDINTVSANHPLSEPLGLLTSELNLIDNNLARILLLTEQGNHDEAKEMMKHLKHGAYILDVKNGFRTDNFIDRSLYEIRGYSEYIYRMSERLGLEGNVLQKVPSTKTLPVNRGKN